MTSELLKPWWILAFGLLAGLLAAGLVWLVASPPRGEAIQLGPLPSPAPVSIHILGAVANPGLYSLPPGSRLDDAVKAAGGLLPEADPEGLNLAMRLEDGIQVQVPLGPPEPASEPAVLENPPTARDSGAAPDPESAGVPVNINQASAAELEQLPGIGPATAAKIIAYRESKGPFLIPEDLMKVSGIGPATYERIKGTITVD